MSSTNTAFDAVQFYFEAQRIAIEEHKAFCARKKDEEAVLITRVDEAATKFNLAAAAQTLKDVEPMIIADADIQLQDFATKVRANGGNVSPEDLAQARQLYGLLRPQIEDALKDPNQAVEMPRGTFTVPDTMPSRTVLIGYMGATVLFIVGSAGGVLFFLSLFPFWMLASVSVLGVAGVASMMTYKYLLLPVPK